MAPRRYYPGFFGALFLVLLRLSIGWHLYYEGRSKIESQETDDAVHLGVLPAQRHRPARRELPRTGPRRR